MKKKGRYQPPKLKPQSSLKESKTEQTTSSKSLYDSIKNENTSFTSNQSQKENELRMSQSIGEPEIKNNDSLRNTLNLQSEVEIKEEKPNNKSDSVFPNNINQEEKAIISDKIDLVQNSNDNFNKDDKNVISEVPAHLEEKENQEINNEVQNIIHKDLNVQSQQNPIDHENQADLNNVNNESEVLPETITSKAEIIDNKNQENKKEINDKKDNEYGLAYDYHDVKKGNTPVKENLNQKPSVSEKKLNINKNFENIIFNSSEISKIIQKIPLDSNYSEFKSMTPVIKNTAIFNFNNPFPRKGSYNKDELEEEKIRENVIITPGRISLLTRGPVFKFECIIEEASIKENDEFKERSSINAKKENESDEEKDSQTKVKVEETKKLNKKDLRINILESNLENAIKANQKSIVSQLSTRRRGMLPGVEKDKPKLPLKTYRDIVTPRKKTKIDFPRNNQTNSLKTIHEEPSEKEAGQHISTHRDEEKINEKNPELEKITKSNDNLPQIKEVQVENNAVNEMKKQVSSDLELRNDYNSGKSNIRKSLKIDTKNLKINVPKKANNNVVQTEEKKVENDQKQQINEKNRETITKDPIKNKIRFKYSNDYFNSFRDWKISKETNLIEDLMKNHFKLMKIYSDDVTQVSQNAFSKKNVKKNEDHYHSNQYQRYINENTDDPYYQRSIIVANNFSVPSIGGFARKNIAEGEKEAQEFKGKMDLDRKADPISDELKELLNKLTLDNYEDIKTQIFDLIKDSTVSQEKLLETLFKKAIMEKSFVQLYAKLCKDIDIILPQRCPNKPISSIFRNKLVEKCRKIFKEEISNIENYIYYDDIEEKQFKIKAFTLGNVNFIAELIKSKILSKNVVFQCLEYLLNRKADHINIEGIIILLDKFGSEINKLDKNGEKTIKPEELEKLNTQLDYYLKELNHHMEVDRTIPGFIKYKLINLTEKRKGGWVEGKLDQINKIKSLKDVHDEYDLEKVEQSQSKVPIIENHHIEPEEESINSDFSTNLKNDLKKWMRWLEEGKKDTDFNWEIVEALTSNGETVPTLLNEISLLSIDMILNKNDLDVIFKYTKNIVTYYEYTQEHLKKFREVAFENITNLRDNSLDNKYLIDFWVYTVNMLVEYQYIDYTCFEKIQISENEQFRVISEALIKSIFLFGRTDQAFYFDKVFRLSFVKNRREEFKKIKALIKS